MNTKEATTIDTVQEEVDQFLEAWEASNKGAWKKKLQLIVAGTLFLAALSLVGYIQYNVFKFNVAQVMIDLKR